MVQTHREPPGAVIQSLWRPPFKAFHLIVLFYLGRCLAGATGSYRTNTHASSLCCRVKPLTVFHTIRNQTGLWLSISLVSPQISCPLLCSTSAGLQTSSSTQRVRGRVQTRGCIHPTELAPSISRSLASFVKPTGEQLFLTSRIRVQGVFPLWISISWNADSLQEEVSRTGRARGEFITAGSEKRDKALN